MRYNDEQSLSYIGYYDSTATTYTERTGATFDLFPDTAVVGDWMEFRGTTNQMDVWLYFTISTALAATSITLAWEYSTNSGTSWSSLTPTDNTSSFTVTGDNTVEWSPLNCPYNDTMYVRARITALSGLTEGGAATKCNSGDNNIYSENGDTSTTLFDTIYTNHSSDGVITRSDPGSGNNSYFMHAGLILESGADVGDSLGSAVWAMPYGNNVSVPFSVESGAELTLGLLDADGNGYGGFYIGTAQGQIHPNCGMSFNNDGTLNLYGSAIYSEITYISGTIDGRQSSLSKVDQFNPTINTNTVDLTIDQTARGWLEYVTTDVYGVNFNNVDKMGKFRNDANFYQCKWGDPTWITDNDRDNDINFYDCEPYPVSVDQGDWYWWRRVDFKVVKPDESDFENVEVKIQDATDTVVATEFTDANGEISRQTLLDWYNEATSAGTYVVGTDTTNATPHSVTFTPHESVTGDVIETGTFSATDNSWQTLTYSGDFVDPYIFITPVTNVTTDYARTAQVRNATASGCEVKVSMDDGASGEVASFTSETFHYMVIDKAWTDSQGWIEIVEGTVGTDGGTTALTLDNAITTAGTLAGFVQGQTYNQTALGATWWLTGRPTTTSASVIGCVHDNATDACLTGQPDETVAVLVIDVDNTSFPAGVAFQSGSASPTNSAWTAATFSPAFTTPRVLVAENEDAGAQDPQYPWARNVTTTGMDFRYCEQDAAGVCDVHIPELMVWIAVEDGTYQDSKLIVDDTYQSLTIPLNLKDFQNSREVIRIVTSVPEATASTGTGVQKSSAGIIRYAD